MGSEREELLMKSKVAGEVERFEAMRKAMDAVVLMSTGTDLTSDERNLFSTAYKNIINAKRASWRVLVDIVARNPSDPKLEKACQDQMTEVEAEIEELCEELFKLLDHLIKTSDTADSKTFFYKMLGDYKRYLAEVVKKDRRSAIADDSLCAYKTAANIAQELSVSDPLRLGLNLNFSVFYYEILDNPEMACKTAKEAYDQAMKGKQDMSEMLSRDAEQILPLLRDNITLWATNTGDDSDS